MSSNCSVTSRNFLAENFDHLADYFDSFLPQILTISRTILTRFPLWFLTGVCLVVIQAVEIMLEKYDERIENRLVKPQKKTFFRGQSTNRGEEGGLELTIKKKNFFYVIFFIWSH